MIRFLLTTLFFHAFSILSQERYNVPGTQVSIIPVEGSVITYKHFSVIRALGKYEMTFMEFHGDVSDLLKMTDSARYVAKGQDVLGQYEWTIDRYPAKVIHAKLAPVMNELVLLFGDTTYYGLVSVRYFPSDKDVFEQIMTALKTIKVDRNKKIDWKRFLIIDLVPANQFKLVEENCSPVNLMFTRNGKPLDSAFGTSSILVQQYINTGEFENSQEVMFHFIPNYLSASNIKVDKVIYDDYIYIGYLKMYNFTANCNRSGVKFQVNAVTYEDRDYVFFLLSQIYNDEDKKEINHFINTLRLK